MKSKQIYFILFICSNLSVFGQDTMTEFSFNEFLGYVKKYHPLVKQADLKLNEAQANLMLARGAFDPKIEVEYNEKQFKTSEYYSILNSSFKIPTWYGIELKAGFDNAEQIYVNTENKLHNSGLTSIGTTILSANFLLAEGTYFPNCNCIPNSKLSFKGFNTFSSKSCGDISFTKAFVIIISK